MNGINSDLCRVLPGAFAEVPRQLFIQMVSESPPSALAAFSQTCKAMRKIITTQIIEGCMQEKVTIGAKQWKEEGVETTQRTLPQNILGILKSDCPYKPNKKIFNTHKLLWMPPALSIDNRCVVSQSKEGKQVPIAWRSEGGREFRPWCHVDEQRDNQGAFAFPYWALITSQPVCEPIGWYDEASATEAMSLAMMDADSLKCTFDQTIDFQRQTYFIGRVAVRRFLDKEVEEQIDWSQPIPRWISHALLDLGQGHSA